MEKVAVLYRHHKDSEAFEKYYVETHGPIATKIHYPDHIELSTFSSNPDGSKAVYNRMAELHVADKDLMAAVLSSQEGQDATNGLQNFATGGVTFAVGTI
jgi:uncharacterized protein (TIGR02118 family)